MAKMTDKEADLLRKQFGSFMTGDSTKDNLFLNESEMTMHTDSHTDSHTDWAGVLEQQQV